MSFDANIAKEAINFVQLLTPENIGMGILGLGVTIGIAKTFNTLNKRNSQGNSDSLDRAAKTGRYSNDARLTGRH